MRIEEFLDELSRLKLKVFTFNEACRIVGKSRDHCKVFLSRNVKNGRIFRLERGKYYVKGTDPFELASNIVYPNYISFLSALNFHKLTTQLPTAIQIVCLKQKKELMISDLKAIFIKFGKKHFFGFRKEKNIFVADAEKAVIDGLYLPQHLPLSESFYALSQDSFDREKIIEYAKRFNSPVVIKRLGYLLEKNGIDISGEVRGYLNTKYSALNPMLPKKGKKNKKWRLSINEVIG